MSIMLVGKGSTYTSSRITTATRYSRITMGGYFDGFHYWISIDGKET
jgi:hypothetical protein